MPNLSKPTRGVVDSPLAILLNAYRLIKLDPNTKHVASISYRVHVIRQKESSIPAAVKVHVACCKWACVRILLRRINARSHNLSRHRNYLLVQHGMAKSREQMRQRVSECREMRTKSYMALRCGLLLTQDVVLSVSRPSWTLRQLVSGLLLCMPFVETLQS